MIKRLLGALFGVLAVSKLTTDSLDVQIATNQINPFPNGRFRFFGRMNGADRKRKSNRLRISKQTRNRHR